MPQLGLGVWRASHDEVISAIQTALGAGYRSIDTASAYKNEEGVGIALSKTDIPREELFITTKALEYGSVASRSCLAREP